jgi:hypothetical protein
MKLFVTSYIYLFLDQDTAILSIPASFLKGKGTELIAVSLGLWLYSMVDCGERVSAAVFHVAVQTRNGP